MTGKGEVDKKGRAERDSGWGNLPAKDRTKAKNIINEKFPSHYARLIEAYTKKIAKRPAKGRGN